MDVCQLNRKLKLDWKSVYESALGYDDYLQNHGTERDRSRWAASSEAAELEASQKTLLEGFSRRMYLLCLSGAWCGDCVESCPIFHQFALACPQLELRFLDRDTDPAVKSALTIVGATRVPQTVVLSEDFSLVDRLGDRTLSKYRDLAAKITGAACSSGLIIPGDPLRRTIIQEWLDQLERCQLILRTSPSLRERHND